MKRRTAQEIADALNVDRSAADGLIKFLVVAKLAKFRGERPNPSGCGKGAHVYEVSPGAGQTLAGMLERLEE